MNFRLILAVDVLDGVVVHAKRGEREQYRPITSISTIISSADPIRVIEELQPDEVYIADLNRLMGTGDNRAILKELRDRDRGLRMMVEYGLRGIEDLKAAVEAEIADNLVLGTETSSMDLIETASRTDISDDTDISISVSVDLFNKEVLTSDKRLKIEPLELINALNEYPLGDVIVLELDRVGTKSGIDFDFFARAAEASKHGILCGGGVRSCEDIYTLEEIGVKGALVATALHDGSIPAFALRKDMR
jgi:phosphoribosylformimino-5-aminoimidazole carboxamide ribotide isomerase